MTLTLDLGTMWFCLYLKKFDFFILLSFRRVPNYKPLWISVIIHIIFSRALWLKLKLCLTSQNAALDITSPGYPQSYLTCSGVSRRTKKVQNVHHCCAVYITQQANGTRRSPCAPVLFLQTANSVRWDEHAQRHQGERCQRAKGGRGHWQSWGHVTNSQSPLLCSVLHTFPAVSQDCPCKWSHFSTEVIWQIDLECSKCESWYN